MSKDVYWVEGPWRGRLAIVPRPRGGDWLEDEIRRWKQSGLKVVLSLLVPDEEAHFQLEREGEVCEAHSLRFVSYPFADRRVPSLDATAALVQGLEREHESGKSVGIHCRQSVGRSALVAACVMVAAGKPPDEAFENIGAARGLPVPETNEQREWVKTFARQLVGT